MIGLLQRVQHASVHIDQQEIAHIKQGLLVLIGVEQGDTVEKADRLLERLLKYRVFADDKGKMNLSLKDINGGLLLVPQFTLAADTNRGLRPSFTPAAPADLGLKLFEHICSQAKQRHATVAAGLFGANMQVSLTNDGPVTFWLQL
ncbi:MAG: D-tyrosyl-tRNA(Tyr) deacylase [Piscirickettsiaceae bacterium]|nr:D-tyrosyl-tRNA(Tyr) deacylase [Piscirickettsiaceae bacterium]